MLPAVVANFHFTIFHTRVSYGCVTHSECRNVHVDCKQQPSVRVYYLLVNNERNMNRISSGKNKKCDFYDDCGAWDHSKGNTCKTTYVVEDSSLRHVELKNNQYCTKVRRQKKVVWVPLDPQPSDENIVTVSRYYATHGTDPSFEKKASYFVRKTDRSLGKSAVYEYKGTQPRSFYP